MATLTLELVETQIIKTINQIANRLGLQAIESSNELPPETLTSNALLNVMGTVSIDLGAEISNDCYIFYDKQAKRRLSVKEAAIKLIKNVTNGK